MDRELSRLLAQWFGAGACRGSVADIAQLLLLSTFLGCLGALIVADVYRALSAWVRDGCPGARRVVTACRRRG